MNFEVVSFEGIKLPVSAPISVEDRKIHLHSVEMSKGKNVR